MLTLDLMENSRGRAALVLAVVVADQVAAGLSLDTSVAALDDVLAVTLPDASERLLEVFVAHLERRLGDGFTVALAGGGVVSVALAGGGVVSVALAAAEEPVTEGEAAEPQRRRPGRPPGSKTRVDPVQP